MRTTIHHLPPRSRIAAAENTAASVAYKIDAGAFFSREEYLTKAYFCRSAITMRPVRTIRISVIARTWLFRSYSFTSGPSRCVKYQITEAAEDTTSHTLPATDTRSESLNVSRSITSKAISILRADRKW